MGDEQPYREVRTAADVTPEIIEIGWDKVEGWYMDGPVDWEDVWDRMDGTTLNDGSTLDLGGDLSSPALKRLKRELSRMKREAQ